MRKSTISDRGYRTWNVDIGQGTTATKSDIFDRGYRVWDIDAR